MVSFNRTDLEFVLEQIKMAEAGQPPVNPHLAFGLREVAGTNNNAVPGQELLGSSDQLFPRVGSAVFQTVTVNVDGTPFDPDPLHDGDTITTSYQQVAADPTANPFGTPVEAGWVIDPAPRIISNLIADQSSANDAATAAAQNYAAQLGDGYTVLGTNSVSTDQNQFIGNITPDAGLSAPFNTWMTLFGQFFDHGLDLVTKGGSGTVFIPLQADDPLYDKGADGIAGTADDGHSNFMVLTRATNLPGADGVLGTADDIHENTNTTSPFVDQSQTYASDPSHQVFLRDYQIGVDNQLHSSGKLLEGHRLDGSAGGMATWGDLKANALKLGFLLTDKDVNDVPLLATDAYGNFIAGVHGFAQVVVKHSDGSQSLIEGTAAGLDLWHPDSSDPDAVVVRTGHAFIDDKAFTAAPVFDAAGNLLPDADNVAGNVINPNAQGQLPVYDDELLNAHYVAGDGRVNENIGLTAVHEVFHNEHNRLIEQVKDIIRGELANGDTSFATDWVLPGADLSNGIQDNEWNGERLFQVAKFGTETQYQHLVFEEFARKIAPTIHLFGNTDIHLDPAITAEFAHAVYRFGHSMLDESLPRFELNADGTFATNPDGTAVDDQIALLDAFTNPLEYLTRGVDAAGEIVQGTTHQIGSEIDEFVTGTLRNHLLGLPLDLPALNIARGRDTGVPPINLLRNEIYAQTHDATLKPYDSWHEFGQFLKHPASLINFVAAYGTEHSILAATTLVDKRAAALDLVTMGEDPTSQTGDAAHQNAYNFMHSLGDYANDLNNPISVHATWSTGSITGLDTVDLWIGGLAEKQNLFGGLLGSTFNFIFETQLENLQDADRLYYLPRIEGIHFGSEIEANSFASLIMENTGASDLMANVFLTPEYTVHSQDVSKTDPSTWLHNPVAGNLLVESLSDASVHALVDDLPSLKFDDGVNHGFDTQIHFIGDDNFLGNTILMSGTEGRDILISGHADDDTVYGHGGDDYIDGGNGNDFLYGGDGNDTIFDSAGDDIIHGDAGNDYINGGIGDDTIFGGDGDDLIETGNSGLAGADSAVGGLGNDIIIGGDGADELEGNEGDDWLSGGLNGDLLVGDQGAPTGQVPLIAGNDVLDGGAGGDRMQGFSGDDIMLGLGGFDKFEGRLGFDWADFEQETHGVSVDMERREFVDDPAALGGDAIRDFFIETEAVSGSSLNDFLLGTNDAKLDPLNELDNVNLIFGLDTFFPEGPVAFSGGNIMLGGDGSDIIAGRGGNDIIDGDAYLHVELIRDANGNVVPGSDILREILWDSSPGDVDTAVFSDVSTNYTIDLTPDAQGFIRVTHNPAAGGGGGGGGGGGVDDGIDLLRNIERLQFSDVTMAVDLFGGNQVPFGAPVIQGDTDPATAGVDPLVGSVLTADAVGLLDFDFFGNIGVENGVITAPIHFQWQYQEPARGSWVNIAGATGSNFTPTAFFDTLPLRLQASYVDPLGFMEVVNSAPTNPVALPAGVNTAPVVVQQQALIGIPDTQALQGSAFSYFLPLTVAFFDQQTAPAQLIYTATLANGQVLDGSPAALGLTFTVNLDAAGAVTNGLISGTLPPGVVGPIDFRITATDRGPGTPLSVTDTFTVNVLNSSQAPTATADIYTINEDTTLAVTSAAAGVLGNDADPQGFALTAALVTNAANGNVTLHPNGTFVYTPNANFAGTDTFTYRASDGAKVSADTLVTINVTPVNDGHASLSIDGFPASGQTLTAVIGADPDGAGAAPATFQWSRDGVAIPTATTATLLLTAADEGHAISVTADYTDANGFHEVVTTAPTDLVGQTFTGTGAANTFDGTAFSDLMFGLGGPDILNGLGGNDRLEGGNGGDTLNGGTGDDLMIGGNGNDNYAIDSIGDVVVENAGGGTDTINTTLNTYMLLDNFENLTFAGAGNFTATGNSADNVISGAGGSDTLSGGDGNDTLNGGGGADTLNGGIGDDTLNGGAGADTLTGGAGNDTLGGGNGDDTFVYNAGDGHDIVSGGAQATPGDRYVVNGDTTDENFTVFTKAAWLLVAGNVAASLNAATEIVVTRNGADAASIISELNGIEEITINTGLGSDTVTTSGNFAPTSLNFNTITINGSSGDDTVDITDLQSAHRIVFTSHGGHDTIIGTLRPQDVIDMTSGSAAPYHATANGDGTTTLSNGTDSITYASDGAPVFTLPPGSSTDPGMGGGAGGVIDPGTDPTHVGEVQAGTDHTDVLIGTPNDDSLVSLGGDDVVIGNAGADAISGGEGSDFLSGGDGRDVMFAGAGDDVVFGGSGADIIYGDAGADRIFGDAGNDLITAGAGDDTVFGGDGNDLIVAEIGDGNDVYFGGAGDADSGIDTLDISAATVDVTVVLGDGSMEKGSVSSSQTGNDTIWGIENVNTGSGNDSITASNSVNVMNGGAGNDTFHFGSASAANNDTIVGFEPGDRIDLSALDANLTTAGDQSFTLVTGEALTAAGQLAVSFETRPDGDYTVVQGNISGGTGADFKISIEGHHDLTSTNFNL